MKESEKQANQNDTTSVAAPKKLFGFVIIISFILITLSGLQIINIPAIVLAPIMAAVIGVLVSTVIKEESEKRWLGAIVLYMLLVIGYSSMKINDEVLSVMKSEYYHEHKRLLPGAGAEDIIKLEVRLKRSCKHIVEEVLSNHKLQTLPFLPDYKRLLTEYSDSCLNEYIKSCKPDGTKPGNVIPIPPNIHEVSQHLKDIIQTKNADKVGWMKDTYHLYDSTEVFARLIAGNTFYRKPLFSHWINDLIDAEEGIKSDYGEVDSLVIDPETQLIKAIYYIRKN